MTEDRSRLGGSPQGESVASRLRTARVAAGLTQRQLAETLGVEPITVSRWERGVTSPSLARIRRVAETTGTNTSDLVASAETSPHSAELAALREELDELRAAVNRMARALVART
jgi:transcriptional regulator with XRE-family HTH domain